VKTAVKVGAGGIAASVALLMMAINFIGAWEGLELKAYRDIVGVWTVCYGETHGVKPGDVHTKPECDTMFAKQLKAFEVKIDSCIGPELPGKTKIAFLSLAYNIGTHGFCSSTALKRANRGDLVGACDAILFWNKAGGKVVQGLVNRREAERALCLEGVREAA
jgi:lysozyme